MIAYGEESWRGFIATIPTDLSTRKVAPSLLVVLLPSANDHTARSKGCYVNGAVFCVRVSILSIVFLAWRKIKPVQYLIVAFVPAMGKMFIVSPGAALVKTWLRSIYIHGVSMMP